ncbi:MAG: hypothetical protein ACXVPQ_08205 [Bacteroidia bacterium]
MADIDYKKIVADCMDAAKTELGKTWKNVEPYAEHEFEQFAENAAFLAGLKAAGKISDDELKARLDIQRMSLNNVLITIEGIGLIAAQNVVNAVIGIVFDAIKTALSVALAM